MIDGDGTCDLVSDIESISIEIWSVSFESRSIMISARRGWAKLPN